MKKILLATAIITIAFTACKKSSTETPAYVSAWFSQAYTF
jgi:hypothetical protein